MNKKQLSLYLLIGCIIPIILFTIVAVAIPYFIKNMDIPTEYDEDTAWGRIFFMNDKISYVPIDSISYLSFQDKELFRKQGQVYGADITRLFTDFNARKITVLSDLHDTYSLQIWYHNGSVHFLNGLTYKRGQWIGNITSNDSIHAPQKINLGRVDGNGYSTKERIIDVSRTYLNGFLILTICILMVCLTLYTLNRVENKWGIWITLGLLGASCGELIYAIFQSIMQNKYLIETIIALFCVSEFSLISTISLIMQRQNNERKNNH